MIDKYALGQQAARTLETLRTMAMANGGEAKIDNVPDVFMALYFERLRERGGVEVWSAAPTA